MSAGEIRAPDWRRAEDYQPLLDADRSIIAWEWLRRDPDYRIAAKRALGERRPGAGEMPPAEHWGLHAFERPELGVPHARPVWSAAFHPLVLRAAGGPAVRESDAFELGRLARFAVTIASPEGAEHLLITDGLRAIRLDIAGGSLSAGPVQLRYLVAGLASAERPVLTLRRFLAFCRTGRFAGSLHPREVRARRWVQMLRAHDALAAGAGQRQIAEVLLSGRAAERRWRSDAPSLRSRAQRLVRSSRGMASGGYLDLLQ